ncbi:MAG: esterase-like activity of phytase family protein [Longimicrobiaceae bacterium]
MPFLLLFVLLLAGSADAQERIAVTATPVPLNPRDPAQTTVGRLRYLGGVQLTSSDPRFGGLSGLRWHDGTLYAVSDLGDFFTLTLVEAGGRLVGVRDARIRRLKGTDGLMLARGKDDSDSESLELHFRRGCRRCPPDSAVVAFERNNRLLAYRLVDGLPAGAATEYTWSAAWRRGLPNNGGVEAMAGGYLLSEELRTPEGRASGRLNWWIGDRAAHGEREMDLPVSDGFSPTDADVGELRPDHPIVVLQRHYTPQTGASARIVIFHPSPENGGPRREVVGLETLAELAPPLSVDNMEGLAFRDDGGSFIYVISDDNFSPTQRTLLLKFEITETQRN